MQLFVTPWTVAHQPPLTVESPRQEYWSGLPFPSPGNLPDPGIEPMSRALAGSFFTTEQLGKPCFGHTWYYFLELFLIYECLFLSLFFFVLSCNIFSHILKNNTDIFLFCFLLYSVSFSNPLTSFSSLLVWFSGLPDKAFSHMTQDSCLFAYTV